MEPHDLTAAYALGALDEADAEAYERHLSQCEECRTQLAELNDSAAQLAYGAVAPAPPPRLRASILETAAAERTNVIPLPQLGWKSRGLAIAAAAAACVAVGLGVAETQSGGKQLVSAVVVVAADRTASLQVTGLAAAPHGKTYEAWIIPPGRSARPAGLFAGGSSSVVDLRGSLPSHAVVAVTLERAGGATAPTMAPILSATT
jgi:anti-sigma-K factor RskA